MSTALSDVATNEDAPFSFTIPSNTFTDSDAGDTLTLSASGLPSWLTFDSATELLSGTPTQNDLGAQTITIRATDSEGAFVEDSMIITVDNVNDAPIVSVALSDQTTNENAPFSFTIEASTFTDPDVGDVLTLSVIGLPSWLSFDPVNGRITGTATEADIGSYTITIQATDEGQLFVQDSITLVVNDTNNQSPVFTSASAVDFAENESGELHIVQADDSDADDSVNFTLGGDDAAQFMLDASSGSLSLPQALDFEAPADANADGEYRLSVTARDEVGHATTQSLQVNVTNVNEAPVILTQSLQIGGFAEPGTLIGTMIAQDPEGSELNWRLLNQDSPFELTPSGVLQVAAALNFESTPEYELNVQADDGSLSTVANVQVTVTDPLAEQAAILLRIEQDNQSVALIRTEGGSVNVTAQITNPEPDFTLSYDWSLSSELIINRISSAQVNEDILIFSPAGLMESDSLIARVNVTRNGIDSVATITIPVAVLGTTAQQTVDSDGDGIPDVFEGDLGAANSSTTANKLQTVSGEDLAHVMESEPGTLLRLGSVARAAKNNQSRLSLESLATYLPETTIDEVTQTLPGGDAQSVSDVFDFEVSNLSAVGESVRVVLPLQGPIVEGDQYMNFHPINGWKVFDSNATNGVRSAPALAGIEGQCPSPGDAVWSEGLVEGNTCIELTIEDGGENDIDSFDSQGNRTAALGLNGTVRNTGGIVSLPIAESALVSEPSRGGGQIAAWLLTMLLGFLGYRAVAYCRNGF